MAAPLNNQNGIGNDGGRPALFETAQELLDKAEVYVKSCIDDTGKIKATISGLAYHLGFASRQSFYDYEERGVEFSYAIKRLRLFIESCYESALYTQSPTGGIFALKNMGWKDKQETELSGGLKVNSAIDLDNLNNDELRILEKLIAGKSQSGEV